MRASIRWSAAGVVLVLGAASLDSMAQPAPSVQPSAGASAAAKVEIPPWPTDRDKLPAFDAEPFPDDKTKPPTDDDWKSAIQVRLSRVSPSVPTGCRAWRVREWMKIHCDMKTAGLRLLAGKSEGVSLVVVESLISEEAADKDWQVNLQRLESMGRFGQIVFPVRRGDRRVFEWLRLDQFDNYEGGPSIAPTSAMLVEEQWLDGEAPEIALLSR
jgi:hypothetical protein